MSLRRLLVTERTVTGIITVYVKKFKTKLTIRHVNAIFLETIHAGMISHGKSILACDRYNRQHKERRNKDARKHKENDSGWN